MRSRVAVGVVMGGLGLGGLVLVVSEAGMQVDPGQRWRLYTVFAGAVGFASLLGWALTHLHRRLPSLRWTILVVAVAAVIVAAGAVGASASAMFLAPADLRVVLAALLLGTGLGVMVAVSVTGPLTADLRALAEAAGQVADGDLGVRSRIQRSDEVGELAASLDRMVEQLAHLEAQRERGEAARRQLLAAIGHDLRTPLASLQAAIEALQDGVAPDPDRYLTSMSGDVERLRNLVDDLFVLSRLEAGEQHLESLPVDLVELADGAVEAVSPLAARRGIEVRLAADDPVTVTGDPQALDRVLRNLLDNAIRHTGDGTVVEVTVQPQDGHALVRVSDQGPGFPPGFADAAFDRFSRADAARDRQGGGAGLGLAICREVVTAHGGRIWIEPGAGGRLAYRLPRVDATRDARPGGADQP